jgi:hypothetical protein
MRKPASRRARDKIKPKNTEAIFHQAGIAVFEGFFSFINFGTYTQ